MDDDTVLNILISITLVLSIPLLIVSTMSMGKAVFDLQYQKVKGLNGIRRIESWTSIRVHANRILFAAMCIVTGIMRLFDVDVLIRGWIGVSLFLLVLCAYSVSACLDALAEYKQLKLLMKYEQVNNITAMRITIHRLSNKLAEYFGVVALSKTTDNDYKIAELEKEVIVLVQSVQIDLHAMDPSYVPGNESDDKR